MIEQGCASRGPRPEPDRVGKIDFGVDVAAGVGHGPARSRRQRTAPDAGARRPSGPGSAADRSAPWPISIVVPIPDASARKAAGMTLGRCQTARPTPVAAQEDRRRRPARRDPAASAARRRAARAAFMPTECRLGQHLDDQPGRAAAASSAGWSLTTSTGRPPRPARAACRRPSTRRAPDAAVRQRRAVTWRTRTASGPRPRQRTRSAAPRSDVAGMIRRCCHDRSGRSASRRVKPLGRAGHGGRPAGAGPSRDARSMARHPRCEPRRSAAAGSRSTTSRASAPCSVRSRSAERDHAPADQAGLADQDKMPQTGGLVFVVNHISNVDPLAVGQFWPTPVAGRGSWPRRRCSGSGHRSGAAGLRPDPRRARHAHRRRRALRPRSTPSRRVGRWSSIPRGRSPTTPICGRWRAGPVRPGSPWRPAVR